jgi:hypothetical protein
LSATRIAVRAATSGSARNLSAQTGANTAMTAFSELVLANLSAVFRLMKPKPYESSNIPTTTPPAPVVGGLQLVVDPADQIAVDKVADEQEQGVGGLVEVAIPQVMARQRTGANVIGLSAGRADLFVFAAMEMPVALELGATGSLGELMVNVVPRRPAVPRHVVVGDLIGDALVAHNQSRQQPIEHGRCVAVPDGCSHIISCKVGSDVVDQGRRTSEAANCIDDPDSVVDACRAWFVNFGMILTVGRRGLEL